MDFTPLSRKQNFTRRRGEIQILEAKGFLFSLFASPRRRVTTSFPLNVGVQAKRDFTQEACGFF